MKWAAVRIPKQLFDEIAGSLEELNVTSVSEFTRKVLTDYLAQQEA